MSTERTSLTVTFPSILLRRVFSSQVMDMVVVVLVVGNAVMR